MADTKTYLTTDKAGSRVAGRIIPFDDEGKVKVGVEIVMTEREAEYELSQGTIVEKTDGKVRALPKGGEGGSGDGSKGA